MQNAHSTPNLKTIQHKFPLGDPIGSKFFKVYQNLVTMSPLPLFLPSPFLPFKNTFMDDNDGIYNCSGLKYSPFDIFNNF